MPIYTKNEARAWARENMRGVSNVIIPTMTSDCYALNENAIRHDVEKSIEHGFTGSLACSEVAITLEEYGQFCRIFTDQAGGRLQLIHHAVFSSLATSIAGAKLAQDAGGELVLLAFPPNFFPETQEDIYNYVKAVADSTDMAIMVFPVSVNINHDTMQRLIDDCPNIAAIKAEGDLMSVLETHSLFSEQVVISIPIEETFVPLSRMINVPYCGTNFSAYFGSYLPRVYDLIQQGDFAAVTAEYNRMTPARKAFFSTPPGGGFLINRMLWKFQSWLQGYNGGPLRHPTARVDARTMEVFRKGLEAAGENPTQEPLREYFIGRNPA